MSKKFVLRLIIGAVGVATTAIFCATVYDLVPDHFDFRSVCWLLLTVLLAAGVAGIGFLDGKILKKVPPRTAVLILIGVALVTRIGWILWVHNEPVSDFAVYEELSQAMKDGKGYALTGPVGREDLIIYLGTDKQLPYTTAYRAPGTSLWGFFLYETFGSHRFVFKISNAILGVLTVLLIYRLFAFSPGLAGPAAFLWAIYPPAFMATNLFGSETLFTFCLLLLAFLLRESRDRSPFYFIPAGIVAAGTALVRSLLLPLCFAVLTSIFLTDGRKTGEKKGWSRAGLFLLFTGLGLSPWAYRNWTVFHQLIPVCTSEGEFLGRHTAMLMPEKLRDPEWQARFDSWRLIKDETKRSQEGTSMARDNWARIVKAGPVSVATCLARGIQATFSCDSEILDWSIRRSFASVHSPGPPYAISQKAYIPWELLTTAFYLFIVTGAVMGAVKSLRSNDFSFFQDPFLAIYFLLFFLAHMLVNGQGRYHFGVMPFLIALASFGTSSPNL